MRGSVPPARNAAGSVGSEIRIGRHVPWRTFNNSILDRTDLSLPAKMAYVVLSSHATANDQRCFPSYATIATEASVVRRTAIRAVAELEAARLLVKRPRHRLDSGSPSSNLYVLFPADAPFDPDCERLDERGQVVALEEPTGARGAKAQAGPGDSQSPGWCPTVTNLVTD